MKAILGLKLDPWHDTGAAIVMDDGSRLRVVAISQERLDRRKHSRAFPAEAIAYCMNAAGCRLNDLSLIVADFILKPTADDLFPGDGRTPSAAKLNFIREVRELGIPIVFAEHHLCHAASAFYATDWDDAATLVIDGHGSYYETQSIFSCHGGGITKLATSHRPGIGWMYSAVTERLLGFDHLQDGKTMGLAGWAKTGEPWNQHFRGQCEASNPCETVYGQFAKEGQIWKLTAPENLLTRQPTDDPVRAPFVQYAYAAQAELESAVVELVRATAKMVPNKRLCYSGGVALNILANRLILDSGLFEDVFIQPAASDAGIALGAALLGYYTVLGGERRWKMDHAFLGREYKSHEIAPALEKWDGPQAKYSCDTVARVLANDYLVAWYRGASEYGPRALGHRSILCLPRHPNMKVYLNREVKHREMFRPFAPIVPVEKQADYFDLRSPSPFMLVNSVVNPELASSMPAIVHADGTARVQSIDQTGQPELHALLNEVGKQTGIPVLLNTSLNLAGEPIVETPADVIDLFSRSRLDALVLGPHLLTKIPLEQLLDSRNSGPAEIQSPREANQQVTSTVEVTPTADASTGTEPAFPLAQTIPFSSVELGLWLDEYLTVCGERRALIAGPGATEIVGKLLGRGIDAWGIDTLSGSTATAHGDRCVGGSLAQLPLENGPFHSALLLGALDDLENEAVREVLNRLRTVVTGSLHTRIFKKKAAHRNRAWWETRFFENGFRKHPIRYYVQPFDCLKYEQPLVMYFERLTENGETFDKDTSKSGPSIDDPTRLTERTTDALMARYELAAPLVRPWDTVLDLGCGCGHGTHLLQRATRGSLFIGVDADPRRIAYAKAHFATKTSEFRCEAPAEKLLELPEASIDFGILALPLNDVGAVAVWWEDLNHVLTPGGRFVFALSSHCSPWEVRHHPIGKEFLLESVYRQSGTEDAPTLQKVSPDDVTSAPSDVWILVAMKDPLSVVAPPYRETFFRNVADGSHADVLRYPDFYTNPWILHSLVHGGVRMSSPEVLGDAARRLLQISDANSADAGAALCILLYRAMEGTLSGDVDLADLIERTEGYLKLTSPNAHQLRWQVSLAFALGQLALQNGDFDRARRRFTAVADFDAFRWGPSLATKTTKALFLAGWLAWCADDLDDARRLWKRGVDFGRTLLARPLDETLMNPEFPNLFCYGDGIRELIQAMENVACCANGLHALGLREQGISCRWDHIVNSFTWQLENVGHSRDAARFNLHHQAEKEATHSNDDAIPPTTAANNPLIETIAASANAIPEEAKAFLAVANEYFERGDLQSCRGSLGWALDVAPDNADILAAMGTVLAQLGEIPTARQQIEKAIQCDKQNAVLQVQLATTCLSLNDTHGFEAALNQALTLDPNAPAARQLMHAKRNGRTEPTDRHDSRLRTVDPSASKSVSLIAYGSGVYHDEGGFRWLDTDARIQATVPTPNSAASLTFNLQAGEMAWYPNQPLHVTIHANGRVECELVFSTSHQTERVELRLSPASRPHQVRIIADQFFTGGPRDPRHLTVQLRQPSMKWERSESAGTNGGGLAGFFQSLPYGDGIHWLTSREYACGEDHYDEQYGYDDNIITKIAASLANLYRAHGLNADGVLLECGAGTGILSLAARRTGLFQTVAVTDPARKFLKICQEKMVSENSGGADVYYAAMTGDDFNQLPVNSVDVLGLRYTLHHILNWQGFIEQSFRLLKKNGALIFEEPYGDGYLLQAALIHFYRSLTNEAKGDASKYLNSLKNSVEFYLRTVPDKQDTEDKHLFLAPEIMTLAQRVGFHFEFFPNSGFDSFARSVDQPEKDDFMKNFLNNCRTNLQFPRSVVEGVRETFAEVGAYVDKIKRERDCAVSRGLFILRKP